MKKCRLDCRHFYSVKHLFCPFSSLDRIMNFIDTLVMNTFGILEKSYIHQAYQVYNSLVFVSTAFYF